MNKSPFAGVRLRTPCALLATAILLGATALAQKPVFEAKFDDPSKVTLKNGAVLGPEGVSGKSKDLSYSSDLANYTSGPGPVALPVDPRISLEGIQELTVTGWFKAKEEVGPNATLFSAMSTQLLWDDKGQQWVWRLYGKPLAGTGKLMNWFKTPKPAPLGAWAKPGEWVYVAMVWRRVENSVEFFQGSSSVPTTQAGKKIVRPESVDPLSEPFDAPRALGNDAAKMDRPFEGNLDDFRFFAKALPIETLEKIRQADLKNTALPQP